MTTNPQVNVPEGMEIVSKDEFFAAVGPRDIITRPDREYTTWETRDRVVIGRSVPGYMASTSAKTYMLSKAKIAKVPGPR
jgi:hypothetical protein